LRLETLDVADGGAAHLGDNLSDGDEDERNGGRDEEDVHGWVFLSDWELLLKQEKGDHCYVAALVKKPSVSWLDCSS
jgi:hypothetical protein